MTITTAKAMFLKVATMGLLAGAVVMAAPQKAQAQVRFGVTFGAPVYARPYYAPRYYTPAPVYTAPVYGYYGERHLNHYEWERQQAFLRHEQWERYHQNYGFYGR